jgi:hypothetical protein
MQNHPDGGAFACTVGTEKAKHVAPPDLNVQMIHGRSVFVTLRQLNGAQYGVGHGAKALLIDCSVVIL